MTKSKGVKDENWPLGFVDMTEKDVGAEPILPFGRLGRLTGNTWSKRSLR
jgi:hypothetical protein